MLDRVNPKMVSARIITFGDECYECGALQPSLSLTITENIVVTIKDIDVNGSEMRTQEFAFHVSDVDTSTTAPYLTTI
jgi:hypothetical protein